tara:strand:- start:2194 stop:2664 length:471 start_codon:yes stop_codon:yes gene_type:complete
MKHTSLYHGDNFGLVLENADICHGVSRYNQQIRKEPGLQQAQFVTSPHQLTAEPWWHTAGHMWGGISEQLHKVLDIAGLPPLRRPWKSVVTADDRPDDTFAGLVVDAVRGFESFKQSLFFDRFTGHAPSFCLVSGTVAEANCQPEEYPFSCRIKQV